jgi:hypothetical protein
MWVAVLLATTLTTIVQLLMVYVLEQMEAGDTCLYWMPATAYPGAPYGACLSLPSTCVTTDEATCEKDGMIFGGNGSVCMCW